VRFAVDEEKCTLCGACVLTCPTDMVREKRGAIKISWVACLGCGHCLAVCPEGAIRLEQSEYPADFAPRPEQHVTPQGLLDLVRTRRTVRRYRAEPVPRQVLEQLLEAARYVPTAANCQCQEFTVLTNAEAIASLRQGVMDYYRGYAAALGDREHPERLAAFAGTGPGARHEHILAAVPAFVKNVDAGRDRLFFGAPAVILVHARRDEVLPEAACSFATLAVALMAEALGLGTCITAYASLGLAALPDLRTAAGVPEGNDVHHVVVVGYPDEGFSLVPPRRPLRASWLD
jgi:nitroreductase/NAD-dependent dihydropyrimidine dehydrogenase PreA subunit